MRRAAAELVTAAASTTEESVTAWATLGAVIVALVFGAWGIIARWADGRKNQAKRIALWGEMTRWNDTQTGPTLFVHNGSDHPIYAVTHPFVTYDDGQVPAPEPGTPGVEGTSCWAFGSIAAGETQSHHLHPEYTNRTPKPLRIAFTDVRGKRWRLWMDGTLRQVHTPLRPGDPVPKMPDDPPEFPSEARGHSGITGYKRGRPPGALPL